MAGFSRHYSFMGNNDLTDKLTAEFKSNLESIMTARKGDINAKTLSLKAGLGETAVRDILQGRSVSPKLETVQKLAKALNVPVYRLIPSMIDQSYAELETLREENRLLKEVHDSPYESMDALRKAAADRPKKK